MQAAIPGAVVQVSYWVGDWTIIITDDKVLDVMRHLIAAPDASFDLCSDVTATDWPPRAERFDVVYCLFSTRLRHRVRVKARLADNKPIASVTRYGRRRTGSNVRSMTCSASSSPDTPISVAF